MDIRSKIIRHAAKEYSSSPHTYTGAQLDVLIENGCQCTNCGESIFEMDDFPSVRNGSTFCEECEREEFEQYCPICEESFEKPEQPKDCRFVLSTSQAEGLGMKPGIYQVEKFPFYLSNMLIGFDSFFLDSITLVRECDVEAMHHKMFQVFFKGRHKKEELSCDYICPCCFEQYTLRKRYNFPWSNTAIQLNRNITIRGILAAGK